MARMKKVIYNGGITSYYDCSDPSVLIEGSEYWVTKREVHLLDTLYYLEGITGKFPSTWFNEVDEDLPLEKPVYLAIATSVPEVDSNLKDYKRLEADGTWSDCHSSTQISYVIEIGNSVYRVETFNSTYFVQVF